ncbi:MAG: dihydrofolate reductase [Gammaproteobacteria bacterium]|nr:dihydrofolate reductase [Gammaproteobacteria bacterium]
MSSALVAVVAIADNGVIGRDNGLPWRLPDDLKRFKALTLGKPILMGRRTFESIGRPLPGRHNLVLTRDRGWSATGVTVVHTLAEARAAAGEVDEIMLIGGAELYRQCWPEVARVELTEVHADVAGDVRLDGCPLDAFAEVSRELHAADERHEHAFSFVSLRRVR